MRTYRRAFWILTVLAWALTLLSAPWRRHPDTGIVEVVLSFAMIPGALLVFIALWSAIRVAVRRGTG